MNFVDGYECCKEFVFEVGVDLQVMRYVRKCGRDGGCGFVGTGEDE